MLRLLKLIINSCLVVLIADDEIHPLYFSILVVELYLFDLSIEVDPGSAHLELVHVDIFQSVDPVGVVGEPIYFVVEFPLFGQILLDELLPVLCNAYLVTI